jgi:hypothetical protein
VHQNRRRTNTVNDREKAHGRHLRGTSMLIMRGEGRTTTEIAKIYGVSQAWVGDIIRSTVKDLGAVDVVHALTILLVTDPTLLDRLRREVTIPDQAREILRDL